MELEQSILKNLGKNSKFGMKHLKKAEGYMVEMWI